MKTWQLYLKQKTNPKRQFAKSLVIAKVQIGKHG